MHLDIIAPTIRGECLNICELPNLYCGLNVGEDYTENTPRSG